MADSFAPPRPDDLDLPSAPTRASVQDGGASPPYQHAAVRALFQVLPHAEGRTLEGQTHEVAPEVLAPVLESFFSDGGGQDRVR